MAGGPRKVELSTPLTMVVHIVKCAFLGQQKAAFQIKMDEDATVYDLKDEIKENQHLSDVVASDLVLYNVNISVPDRDAYKAVMETICSRSVTHDEELDYPECKLSEFKLGFPPKVIHILVDAPPPASESFISRPGGLSLTRHTPHLSLAYRPPPSYAQRLANNDDVLPIPAPLLQICNH